ncbi:CDP-glucose 4,6-dehydratase [Alcaligenaceae bacterium LF4-65]|uniref:CDP-glucose 4,6-dehydratase n=1 Tax=Zwartia hollandica TaxID=324606 RepID=A0A953T455_9BURK|nr:CDP-glucose 4,6-dehydratase [Zwartia hollandica]MBZ1350136.1 CDP-glucose 4,6-dehydratase [Zwartia hollandica]
MESLVMTGANVDNAFWSGKRVFLTGHTGFKGSWLSIWLVSMGATVTGFSLAPNTEPSLFKILDVEHQVDTSILGNINDLDALSKAMRASAPEIVIHMAAQPLVRYGYTNPLETYATNILGTAHVLEAVRQMPGVRAVLVVTTDKCYENKEQGEQFQESDPLGGYDPYSSSKACAELITAAYRQSYFTGKQSTGNAAIATARAGNVIGGGDWSTDRLIPDAIRAFNLDEPIIIRNPQAIRPWQHVIEPLSGYLLLLENLYHHADHFASAWNFGPQDSDTRSVSAVIELMARRWHRPASWSLIDAEQPHEAQLLRLDCRRANNELNWRSRWSLEIAIEKIVAWHRSFDEHKDMLALSLAQIIEHQTHPR